MKKLAIAGLATVVSTAAVADVEFYGFLKGDVTRADKMNTDEKPFFATAKGSDYSDYDKQTHSVMSFRDSRAGMNFDNGSKVKGNFEFDFDGETGTSGATKDTDGVAPSSAIRWRQANLSYTAGNGTLTFGKQWAIFSGANQHTMQVSQVGLFQGKTGFITDAITYKHSMGDLGIAAQLSGADIDDGDNSVNKVSNPTTTLRFDYKLMDHNLGFVYSMANKNFKKDNSANTGSENVDITAMKLFGDLNFGMTNVRFEYAQGKNAVGSGWLTKLQGAHIMGALTNDLDVKDAEETAMFVSAKHQMGKSAVWARYGVSELTNADDVFTATATGATGTTVTGVIAKNAVTGIGYSHELDTNFTVYGEYTMVTTDRLKTAGETDTNSDDGTVLDIGMMYKF